MSEILSEVPSEVREVILWGASQVGKTTALAAYFSQQAPNWLDPAAEESSKTLLDLRAIWNQLLRNQIPTPTPRARSYDIRSRQGTLWRFRDIRGGDAEALNGRWNEEDLHALRAATGVMLFLSWPGGGITDGVIAARNALGQLGRRDRPIVLVVTKVESYLEGSHLMRFYLGEDPSDIARDLRVSQPFQDLLREFPREAIFPITVYGYAPDGQPAHFLDEFGQLVPWRIKPQLVERPFKFLFEGLSP